MTLIVKLYSWSTEVFLWLMIIIFSTTGYNITVPTIKYIGMYLGGEITLENEIAWKLCGAFLFTAPAFLLLAIFTGPFLVLLDIRKSIVNLESRLNTSKVQSSERKDPQL